MKIQTNQGKPPEPKAPNTEGTGSSSEGVTSANVKPTEKPAEGSGSPAERPAWLPEGFNSPEELAAAYAKLAPPKADEKKAEPAKPVDPKDAEKFIQDSKLDLPALEKEWRENGNKLSDASLKALAEKGVTPEVLNQYIAGRQAEVDKYEGQLAEAVGGKESLEQIVNWANENIGKEEAEAINEKLSNMKDPMTAKLVMQGLQARYERAMGRDGKLVTGRGSEVSTPAGVQPIADMRELTALMKDKRYQSGDAAFHKMVEARIAVSPNLYGGGE